MAKIAKLIAPTVLIFDQSLTSIGVALSHIEAFIGAGTFDPEYMVDEAARFRAAKQKTEGMDKLLSDSMKDAMSGERMQGIAYEACLSTSEKLVLDTEAVKALLGKKLPNFQKIQAVRTLTYKPKV